MHEVATIGTLRKAVAVVVACILAVSSFGAEAQQQPYPAYPPQIPPGPAQPYVQQPYPYGPQQQQPQPQRKPSFLRELFVGTIGAILQGIGGVASGALAQGLTGTIVSWFSKKQNDVPYGQYAGQPPPQYSAYPQYPTYPQPGYPAPAYPNAAAYSYEPQMYDMRSGQMLGTSAQAYYSRGSGLENTLYAGVAYEVHALGPDGTAMPINPLTYAFRTGERFLVYYRPSMPGRIDVYNINPLGRQTRIDSANMAAGQLATLGPYEFTATAGRDALRLVLMPCSTNELLVATRSIVNVPADPAANATGFPLSSCGAPTTRSIKTRDITKVALDGMTSFAIDPLSQEEYSSGQVDPREIVIVFQHQ